MSDKDEEMPGLLYSETNIDGTAEPLTVEKLRALHEKLLNEAAAPYREIISPQEYKLRVIAHLRNLGREN